MTRGITLPLLFLLAACRQEPSAPPAPPSDISKGVARSVADVEAAEAAIAMPLPPPITDNDNVVAQDDTNEDAG